MKTRHIAVSAGVLMALLMLAAATFAQSSPPLTYMQIVSVRSQSSPAWETIAEWQTSTLINHGGTWAEVKIKEVGESANWSRLFTFNGQTTFNGRLIRMMSAGKQGAAWYRIWRIEGNFVSGRVFYRARSLTSREFSDGLNIR